MVEPFAATRLEVRGRARSDAVAGKTLSSAPESIRKWRRELTSKIEIDDEEGEVNGTPAAATIGRPCRFPGPEPNSSSLDGALDIGRICMRMLSSRNVRE